MPAKLLLLSRKADKELFKLPFKIQNKIVFSLERLKVNPLIGIKLQGELSDYRKLRVGDYRIVYRFESKTSTLEVVKIEHRQGVYK